MMTSGHENTFHISGLLWEEPKVIGEFSQKGTEMCDFNVLCVVSVNKLLYK